MGEGRGEWQDELGEGAEAEAGIPWLPCQPSPGPGPGEARLPLCPSPQPAIPEEALSLSAANASQQPPSPKLVGLAGCSETAFAPNGLYQGENKALESFQSTVVISAEAAGPSGGTSQGTLWVQACPKAQQAAAAAPQLSVPALALLFPSGVQARPFNKCWPEDNGSIFTKKCSAAKSGLGPAANEKIKLVGFFFFFLSCCRISWKAGMGQALEQRLTLASCPCPLVSPFLVQEVPGRAAGRADLFLQHPQEPGEKKGNILSSVDVSINCNHSQEGG